jgi:hypothetical protein
MKKVLIGLAVATLAVSTAQARPGKPKLNELGSNSKQTAEQTKRLNEVLRASKNTMSSWTEFKRTEPETFRFLEAKGLTRTSGSVNVRGLVSLSLATLKSSISLSAAEQAIFDKVENRKNLTRNLKNPANVAILVGLAKNVAALKNAEISTEGAIAVREATYLMVYDLATTKNVSKQPFLEESLGVRFARLGYSGKELATFENVSELGNLARRVRQLMAEGRSEAEAREMAINEKGGKELMDKLKKCV